MQGFIYEEPTAWPFLIVTLLLGGLAAWMSGRSTAQMWRPWGVVLLSMLGLAAAARFIHYALAGGTFFSLHYYVVDYIFLAIIGSVAYRYTRTGQMVTQYSWQYERTSPFNWRPRQAAGPRENESG